MKFRVKPKGEGATIVTYQINGKPASACIPFPCDAAQAERWVMDRRRSAVAHAMREGRKS